MSLLFAICLGWGLWTWAADAPPPPAADAAPQATTTAPADNARPLRGPLRRRLGEGGPFRRDQGLLPGPGGLGGPGPRRGERPGLGPPPGSDQPLTPRDIDELMQFAHDNFPAIHDRLDRLRQKNPREFQVLVRRVYNRLRPLMDMLHDNPQAAEKAIQEHRLQMIITGLVEQYRNAKSDDERSRLKTEIQAKIRERFDRHQERIRLEIQTLRKRLDEQERQLSKREQNKEELLRKELERSLDGQPNPPPPGPDSPRPRTDE